MFRAPYTVDTSFEALATDSNNNAFPGNVRARFSGSALGPFRNLVYRYFTPYNQTISRYRWPGDTGGSTGSAWSFLGVQNLLAFGRLDGPDDSICGISLPLLRGQTLDVKSVNPKVLLTTDASSVSLPYLSVGGGTFIANASALGAAGWGGYTGLIWYNVTGVRGDAMFWNGGDVYTRDNVFSSAAPRFLCNCPVSGPASGPGSGIGYQNAFFMSATSAAIPPRLWHWNFAGGQFVNVDQFTVDIDDAALAAFLTPLAKAPAWHPFGFIIKPGSTTYDGDPAIFFLHHSGRYITQLVFDAQDGASLGTSGYIASDPAGVIYRWTTSLNNRMYTSYDPSLPITRYSPYTMPFAPPMAIPCLPCEMLI